MAEVLFTKRALRDLRSLEPFEKETILRTLRENAEAPLARARKLRDPRIGTFRYRIGDLRIIFDLHDDKIVVLRVGNRKDIYR